MSFSEAKEYDDKLTVREKCMFFKHQYYNFILKSNHEMYEKFNTEENLTMLRRIIHIFNTFLRLSIINDTDISYITKLINGLIYQTPWDEEGITLLTLNKVLTYLSIKYPENVELENSITEYPLETSVLDEMIKLNSLDLLENDEYYKTQD